MDRDNSYERAQSYFSMIEHDAKRGQQTTIDGFQDLTICCFEMDE